MIACVDARDTAQPIDLDQRRGLRHKLVEAVPEDFALLCLEEEPER